MFSVMKVVGVVYAVAFVTLVGFTGIWQAVI